MGEANLERRLVDDLNGQLMADSPFAAYELWLDEVLRSAERVRSIYEGAVDDVLRTMKIDLPADARIEVVARADRGDLAPPIPDVMATTAAQRAGASAVAGGVIAALVVKKLVAKGTLKLASKAFVKVVLTKAAGASGGAGVGAAIGAIVGSVGPVLGTAAGAAAGGVVGGLVVGVGADYLMLNLEEAWSREAFRVRSLPR